MQESDRSDPGGKPDAASAQPRKLCSRILPPAWFFIAVMAMVALHNLWPVAELLVYPWTLVGLPFMAAGLVVIIAAVLAFRRHQTAIKPHETPAALVTVGIYRFSRNPMYLSMVLMLFGVALGFGTLTPWLPVPLFVVLIDRCFIRPEETALEKAFGDRFREYRRRVRRWV